MINPIFLSLLIFGAWVSYYDLRKREIKNYSILLLILVAIFINIFFTKAFINYPLASAINVFLGVVAGLIIWLAGLWPAADAKLFIAINFLIPVTFYKHFPGLYFPGLAIFINSCIPLFLFLFIQTLTKTSLKEKKEALFSQLKFSFVGRIFLIVAGILSFISLTSYVFKIRMEYFIWIIFLFLAFWFIEQKLSLKLNIFFLLMILLALIFYPQFLSISFLLKILFFSLIIFFLYIIISLSVPLYTRFIKIEDLKEGMIPAEMIFRERGRYIKRPMTFLNILSSLREKSKTKPLIGYNPDGLETEDIKRAQSLYDEKKFDFDQIKISESFALSPVLFLGGLLTYFFKGIFYMI